MRISDWSSDVCSSDLVAGLGAVILAIYLVVLIFEYTAVDVPLPQTQPPPAPIATPLRKNSVQHTAEHAQMPPHPKIEEFLGQIGRASCRESVCAYVWISVVAVSLKNKKENQKN